MNQETLQAYWRTFEASLDAAGVAAQSYEAETFGDSPQLADELGELILAGTKTASCSALWEWEAECKAPPKIGRRTIVLDGSGNPLCVIEITDVQIRLFRDVDIELAFDEGEGDRTLEYWRRVHWDYFSRILPRIGRAPSEDMPLVCERFRAVFE